MTFSVFVTYFLQNKRNVPARLAERLRQEAMQRVKARSKAGRAEAELCFRDLALQMEDAIAPKSNLKI